MIQIKHKGTKITLVVLAVILVGALAFKQIGQGDTLFTSTETEPVASKAVIAEYGRVTAGVTETGTVSIGTMSQSYDLDLGAKSETVALSSVTITQTSTAQALVVESVDVSVGQVVQVGDTLLTLTEDSVGEVSAALEEAVLTAQYALTEVTVARDKAKLEADYTYKANLTLGTTAQAEYDATIAQLNIDVAQAEKAIADTHERIAEIPDDITDIKDEIEDLDDDDDSAQILKLEGDVEDLEDELKDLQNSLPALQLKLEKAKRDQTTGRATAKQTFESNLVLNKNAKSLYQVALNGIDDDVYSASDELQTAKDNIVDFKDLVSDHKILSDYTGTITSIGYAAGDSLTSATDIATIQNAVEVTVEVDIAQDDISVVEIGDTVNIEFSAYPDELYTATVTQVSASVTDFRTSTVSYPVIVTLSGDVSKIYDGMTGNVTFITKEVTNVIYVSNKAIINEGTVSYVKRQASDGTIEKVVVKTGFSNGYQVEIKSGLAVGDVVIIESQVTAP